MSDNKLLEELKKCRNDPIYFIGKYIKVVHPVRGLVPFKLYPFQKDILGCLKDHRFNILRKFRQAGCTTIAAAYALYFVLFQTHQTVVILSKGDAESTEVLDRIKIMYNELPQFLKVGIEEDNKHTFKLINKSQVKSRSSGKQAGRSLAGSLLIIDEAAFIESINTIWAAVYPIISTGGRAFVLSTTNGIGNWFQETYQGAIDKTNSFNPIDINWKDHPEYRRHDGFDWLYTELEAKGINVDIWEKTTKSNIRFKQWLQEYECSFLGTGDTYLDGEVLKSLVEDASNDYYIKHNNRMRVWKDPHPEYTYTIGVDCALGRDRDYSAFHVMNNYTGEQVAEFYSNRTPINEFASIIAKEGTFYNTATVVAERNTIGENLIDWLLNILEYDNLWMDEKGTFGFLTNLRTREQMLATMEEFIRNKVVKINSKRTIDEFLTFIIDENGKITADAGKNDDLIISLALSILVMRQNSEILGIKIGGTDKNRLGVSETAPPSLKSSRDPDTSTEDYKWLMN